jgi:tetratricopeptide (TPR) repeat protein
MKKVYNKLVFFSLASLLVSACTLSKMIKMSKDQKLTVAPNPLEVHGDSVKFSISANLPVKMLRKNKVYTVNTFYKAGESVKMALGDLQFKSDDFPKAKVEQPSMSKSFSFPFQPNYTPGDLNVMGIASTMNGKSKSSPELPIAKGIITTSRLVKDFYFTSYAPHGYDGREELEPVNLSFYFDKGKSALKTKDTEGQSGKFFARFLANKNVTRTISIVGSHSPEGAELVNSKLAEQRAKAVEKYYRTNMLKYNTQKAVDSVNFVLKAKVQDWEAFKTVLDSSRKFTYDEKISILAVLNNGAGDFLAKEKQLQKLKSYSKLLKEIYPLLRTSTTELLVVKKKKSDATMSVLSKAIVQGSVKNDTLSDKELAYAATLTPDLKEKEDIYLAATKKNDSWVAHNNLAAVQLDQAKKTTNADQKKKLIESALLHLEIARAKNENASEVQANIGTAYLLSGNLAKSKEALVKAAQWSKSNEVTAGVNSAIGVFQIKMGDYAGAIASLSNGSDVPEVKYNLALAYLLSKNFESAKAAFKEAQNADQNNAWAYYCAAITGARMNNVEDLVSNLSKAVKLDSSLKSKATLDLEFRDFVSNPEFINALK